MDKGVAHELPGRCTQVAAGIAGNDRTDAMPLGSGTFMNICGETDMYSACCKAGDRHLLYARTGLLCAILVLSGYAPASICAAGERPAAWATAIPNAPGLPNLYQVTPTLYRAAQPLPQGLTYLGALHPLEPGGRPIKTVLSLRARHDDAHLVLSTSSMRYEQIRFKAWHPENEDIIKFLRIVMTPALQPVLVHCHHGSDRTGTMSLYTASWSRDGARQLPCVK